MSNVWSDFNKKVDREQLHKDIEAAKENKFSEVPPGIYHVKVETMKAKISKNGNPKCSIQFRILEGDRKNQCIFYHQAVNNGFGIHKNNEFLRSMELDCVDEADEAGNMGEDLEKYAQLIMDAGEEIDEYGITYDLEYTEGNNGYHNFYIEGSYG